MACPQPFIDTDIVQLQIDPVNFQCAIPCKGTMVSPDDAEDFVLLQKIVGTLGFLGSMFLVLTWGFFPQKKKQHLTFWFSVCSLFNSLCVVIGLAATGGDLDELLCKDEILPNSQADGISLCVVLSAVLLFFGTGQCVWWGFTAVDLYRKIVLGKRNTRNEKKMQHLIAWGLCSAVLIAAVSLGMLGNQQGDPFCFLALTSGNVQLSEEELLLQLAVFYGLIVTITFVGTFCMFSVIYIIIRQLRRLKVLQQVSGKSALRQYNMYRTPFVFVFIFVFVWGTIFTHRLVIGLELETYELEAEAWILCFITSSLGGIADPANDPNANTAVLINADPDQVGCGLRQPGGVPKSMFIMLQLVVLGQGFFSFLIFGLRSENFKLWRYACSNCSVQNLFNMTYTSKTSKADTASYSTTPHLNAPRYYQSQDPRYYQPQDPRYPSPPSYSAPSPPGSRHGSPPNGQRGRVFISDGSPPSSPRGAGGGSTFGRSGFSDHSYNSGSSYSSGQGMRGGYHSPPPSGYRYPGPKYSKNGDGHLSV